MHDDGTSGGPMRQVKVDNWGIFFLQRLQQFFNRSDHCDLTLQFAGNVKIKVHRLVLNACTEYFQALEKKIGKTKDNCLTMPADLSPDVVLPIINFMYTGRLEFRDSLTKKLYYTAGRLNMPVLTKLLDAQGASELSSEPSMPTVSLTPKPSQPSIISKSSNSYGAHKKMTSKELPETLPGRKLPIWKKRRTPFLMSSFDDSGPAESAALAPDHPSSVKEEPARPTRFEWPEDEETLKSYVPPFDSITYESAPLQLHSQQPPRPIPVVEKKATFEELQSRYQPIKRHTTALADNSSKKSKMMDMQSVKEYLQEQEVRKQIVSNEEDGDECTEEGGMALGDVVEDDDEDDDEREAESILPDHEDGSEMHMEEGQDDASPSTPHHTKSILKQRFTEEITPASKKVRFALASQEPTYTQMEEYTTEIDGGEGSSEMQASPANHAKIISEVLKKYPHLVRDNKNIRLRIMKQGSCPSSEVESKNKKVSYVVLKAGDTGKNRSPAKVIVKTGGRVEHISSLVPPTQTTKPVSGAENTTGPWLCFSCGTNEDPINFETYYEYRRHLQDVHMEKIDARICEHCGHRASKRNLLLYHLYTKHSVLPPRNCQFPKCDQCDYVALSESLLIKHRNNHSNAKDYVCKVCNASFKSNGALQGHMQTNLHSDPDKKKYECPYCRKPFVRNINLKAHVRTAHKDVDRKLDDDEQDMEGAATDEGNFDPKRKKRKDVLLLRGKDHSDGEGILARESSPHSLEPSSEAEALSNVASGIAASLGLADQLEVHHDHQTVVQTMPDGTVQTFIISAVQGQEYIVPEMLANAASGDQYQLATAGTLADLVQYDGTNLGAVVSSLAGASGQQTIVITTAPSGGQEHLKLISADGSTLDQVTLLTGQNLLVTNPDGTTSTASATEGYQAILQPNGVLTLQPVGTHVLHGELHDGEAVTEETLVQQGYHVAQGTYTLTTSEEVQREVEQSMNMLTADDVDTKPYTLITTAPNQQQLEEAVDHNEQQLEEIVDQSVGHSVEPTDEQNQLENALKVKKVHMPIKPRIIGTPIAIQRDDVKSELVSNTGMQSQVSQMQSDESTEMQPDMAQIQSELSEMQSEIAEMQPVMTEMQPAMTELQQGTMEEEDNTVQHSENVVEDMETLHENVSTLEQENVTADPNENQGQVLETEELQEEEPEVQQEVVSGEQDMEMEPQQMQHQEDSSQGVHEQLCIEEEHQVQEGEKICSDQMPEEQITQEMVQEEGSGDMIDAGEPELVDDVQYHSNVVEQGEDSMIQGVVGEGELETMQGVEEGDHAMEVGGGDEEEGTLLIEGDDEQGPLMIEAEEAAIAPEEGQGELLMREDEVLSQDQSQDTEEQGALTIQADQQESVSQDNSGSGMSQDQPPSDAV